mmetsp:Transcript_17179/g.32589  ORF Transcript_17179/g.32589 Transcript_17179/m.32589 type:complete len:86 (+) Transcript_17179:250-507(+)
MQPTRDARETRSHPSSIMKASLLRKLGLAGTCCAVIVQTDARNEKLAPPLSGTAHKLQFEKINNGTTIHVFWCEARPIGPSGSLL